MPANAFALSTDAIHLGRAAADKADAITQCGQALVALGAVEPPYVAAMHERESVVSTFVGRGVAIPHGNAAARQYVRRSAVAVLQFPDGVNWDGDEVQVCIAIAADTDEPVGLLSALATMLLDEQLVEQLRAASDPATVIALLQPEVVTGRQER